MASHDSRSVSVPKNSQDTSSATQAGVCWAGSAAAVKAVNLALQGGGAHAAFAWGVLDRLLEDERIVFEGISAASAGALNATVLAYGLAVGGRDGAKRALQGSGGSRYGGREHIRLMV